MYMYKHLVGKAFPCSIEHSSFLGLHLHIHNVIHMYIHCIIISWYRLCASEYLISISCNTLRAGIIGG